jgi:RNA polymerase sigma-70 factor (ECF subfamily)
MHTAYQSLREPATAAGALERNSLDEALLRSIAAGDKGAMRVLFQRHSVRVYRFALRLIEDAALAEDIVSEVFMEVWRGARGFKAKSQVTTWLLAITRHKASSALRRRSEASLDDDIAAGLVDPGDDPELMTHHKNRGKIIRMCLNRLSLPHREVIDLVYYHERSIDEAARIVGVSKNTIKSRMMHARRQMGKLLSAACVDVL